MTFREISFGSSAFQKECELRHKVLRAPIGLSLWDENLDDEKHQLHFGIFNDDNDQLIACAIAVLHESLLGKAKIRQMAVDDEYRGTGIGSELMQQIESVLLSRGVSYISLHARITAVCFYEKLGYTKSGDEFIEVGIPHILMGKGIHIS